MFLNEPLAVVRGDKKKDEMEPMKTHIQFSRFYINKLNIDIYS